jgi:hypothetical protein
MRSKALVGGDHSAEDSLVGGFSIAYPPDSFLVRLYGSRLAKYSFTWPLARLTLEADALSLAPRGPFKILMKPIVIRYAEITSVEAWTGRRIGTIVFNCRRPEVDGASFGAVNLAGLDRLLDLLARKGVTVERR